MNCRNCKNENAWHTVSVLNNQTDEYEDQCDQCGLQGLGPWVPDVYLKTIGQKFENLCDNMGHPYEIRSKRHKKEVMDRLGVSEAGDKIHGAPVEAKSWIEGSRDYRRKQFEKDRPMLRETLKRWKETGYAGGQR